MSLLLSLGNQLIPVEAMVLSTLKAAADNGDYWDTLGRLQSMIADVPIILQNITTKARAAGLTPQLEALKENHDAMENSSRDPAAPVSAAPAD